MVSFPRHYTCHEKAVITKPQNVYILRDIQSAEYIAGSDTRFFGSVDLSGDRPNKVTSGRQMPEVVVQQMRNRLQFEQEFADSYQSMLAFLSPWAAQEQFMQDNAFSLSGGVGLPWDIGTGVDVKGNGSSNDHADVNFPGGYEMFSKYNKLFGLSQIHAGEDRNQKQSQQFVREGVYNNSVCLLGPHRVYSPFAKAPFELVPGQGHFGPDALPGVRCNVSTYHHPPSLHPFTLSRYQRFTACAGCALAQGRGDYRQGGPQLPRRCRGAHRGAPRRQHIRGHLRDGRYSEGWTGSDAL